MRFNVFLLLLVLLFQLAGCTLSNEVPTTAISENMTDMASEWAYNLFISNRKSDAAQADDIFEQLVEAITGDDMQTIRNLFSENALLSAEDFDDEVTALFDFFEGNLVSFKRYGPGSDMQKEGGFYKKEVFASYDIFTDSSAYRLAIRFCTADSQNSDNIGVTSIYITVLDDATTKQTYWGGEKWIPGVNIE